MKEVPLALVYDSDPGLRAEIAATLSESGLDPVLAGTPREALDVFRSLPIAVAVLGMVSSGEALYDLLGRGLALRPTAVAAVAQGDGASGAVEAAMAGAFDVFARPPVPGRLRAFAVRAAAQHRLLQEMERARSADAEIGALLTGRSEAIEALRRRVGDLAAGGGPVLFTGEPGSGRTQAARALFAAAAARPEVVPAAARDAEGRIFGPRERGAGVHVAEVHALRWALQERLAGALADGALRGRLTASTYLDPARGTGEARIHRGLLRAFGGAVVEVPPLRKRLEDVPVLARALVEGLRAANRLPPIAIAPEAIGALSSWSWPGNVDELKEVVETAVVLSPGGEIGVRDLPAGLRGGRGRTDPGIRAERTFAEAKRAVIAAFERAYLVDLLERHHGQVTIAAARAGLLRSGLQRLLRKHDLRSRDYRGQAPRSRGA